MKKLLIDNKIRFTEHAIKRLYERSIKIKDIISGITTGEIIEEYRDDYPYPSCLILGKDSKDLDIHIVCGISEEIWIMSAYYPNTNMWEEGFKERKGNIK